MASGENTIATAFNRIKDTNKRIDAIEDILNQFMAPFAWYYDQRGKDYRYFAIIQSITGTKADLMIIGTGCSGGAELVRNVEILKGKDYERRWEPMVRPIMREINLLGVEDEAVTKTALTA